MKHQEPVVEISLMVGLPWRLNIWEDGSAKVRYEGWGIDETAQAAPGTVKNFEKLVDRLIELSSPNWRGDRSLVVFLHRQGQTSCQQRFFRDAQVVTRLFQMAITLSNPTNDCLNRLFRDRWPYC
jgi:hypothetical protein